MVVLCCCKNKLINLNIRSFIFCVIYIFIIFVDFIWIFVFFFYLKFCGKKKDVIICIRNIKYLRI